MRAANAPANGYDDRMSPKTPPRKTASKRAAAPARKLPAQKSSKHAKQPGEPALLRWLKDRNITEVECLVPDITGNARGKIIPAAKFSHDYGTRLPEGIFATTVTGDHPDEYDQLVSPSDSDMYLRPDPDAAACRHRRAKSDRNSRRDNRR